MASAVRDCHLMFIIIVIIDAINVTNLHRSGHGQLSESLVNICHTA